MSPPEFSSICEGFCRALNELRPGWQSTSEGVVGPGGAFISFEQRHHSAQLGHVDVGFKVGGDFPLGTVLWDCVSGQGNTPEKRADFAARIWSATTGVACLELQYSLRGEYADHYQGTEMAGFPGWHCIHGAIIGFGQGSSPARLQDWWLDNPVLPAIAHVLGDSLDEATSPHGIKILFGGDGIAEVRLDGERHEAASAALANLPWPRLHPGAVVRSYVILLHRQDTD